MMQVLEAVVPDEAEQSEQVILTAVTVPSPATSVWCKGPLPWKSSLLACRLQGKHEDEEDWSLAPGMTARQRTMELQARKAKLAAQTEQLKSPVKRESRAKRDREANAVRGPPPEPSRSKRMPPELVPDLIMVWELLHVRCRLYDATLVPYCFGSNWPQACIVAGIARCDVFSEARAQMEGVKRSS